ncbi:hypothetical protein [Allostreptomyces psammosilenae]|uniref:Uncharacterized protein n=1 Tax=Allostreptomyces psammosilenae TaxID=1892865 RepID=A0A852ZZB5_9ACTN|nr:hypothetical protein [Allostreptomyces psammosilenae]NYI07489.1 hypothetical protein [Allostreptomyces psammosilenae]
MEHGETPGMRVGGIQVGGLVLGAPDPARPARPGRSPEVRAALVRAVLAWSLTLILGVVGLIAVLADSLVAVPALLLTAAAVVVSSWASLDVAVARQVSMERAVRLARERRLGSPDAH